MFLNKGKKTRVSRLVILVMSTAVALTIAAVCIPNLLRSRVAANEASAVGSIRTLNTALVTYSGDHPGQGYPQRLSDLTPYIGTDLASGQKSGYSFRYVPQTSGIDGVVKSFRIEAAPITAQAGQRRFSSDQSGQIRYQAGRAQPERHLGDDAPHQPQQLTGNAPRMIQKASLNLVVSDPFATGEKIRGLSYRMGGYVDSVRSSDEGPGARETSISIRVPADRFEEARREIRSLSGRLRNEQDDARDVSAQHVDLASHLRNYRAEEAQYLEIMQRSGSIKDTLAVSERLADVRGRIEHIQGQLDQLAHETEMALLEVNLQTEATVQPVDVHWHPVAEIKAAFSNAADDLSAYANFMIAVLFRFPVIALWTFTIGASSLGVWRLLRWTWKRFVPSSIPAA